MTIARGWRNAHPFDSVALLPMSDGGDGFGEVMSGQFGAIPQNTITCDAAHRRCRAKWWWEPKSKTAVIESARVVGLAMLPPGQFHPFELDTFGLGKLMQTARTKDARQIFIGIGGSATNDGGFGLARAVGWKFLDRYGQVIERWTDLHALSEVRPPMSKCPGKVVVAVDVQNRLLGAKGATRIYGPQKGLRPQDLTHAEYCLRRLSVVAQRRSGRDSARLAGAGAAGGLGFGLAAFLDAKLLPGFELFVRHSRLIQRLRKVDLVITGEGAIDRSTAMGKGVGQIAVLCSNLRIPCIGLAGKVTSSCEVNGLFQSVYALTDLTTEGEAKRRSAFWLERLAANAGRKFPPFSSD